MTLIDIAPVALRPERTVTMPLVPRQARTTPTRASRTAAIPAAVARTATMQAKALPTAVHEALPVTTLRQGARVAIDRTRRFTLLGQVPVLGALVVPWLWPLHMAIVGRTADHIRQTPDASLSYCDGTTPRPHHLSSLIAVVTFLCWIALAAGTVITLLHNDLRGIAIAVAVVLLLPALVELIGLIEFAVLNPEWVTLKRQLKLRTDGRTTYVLTSIVARRDGQDAAGRLMDLTYPQWQAEDAVVIGYPASKHLISYYVRMGAKREHRRPTAAHPARRRIAFDCRQPLRGR